MDTTSFHFETDNFINNKNNKSKKTEIINEKTTYDEIYSELNNIGDKNK